MNNPADDIPQSERRRIMADDRRGRTYMGHAMVSADDERGGRFALSGNVTSVTGSSPGPIYPPQPSTSPANQMAMMPDEPLIDGRGEGSVLGYAIDKPDVAQGELTAQAQAEGSGGPSQVGPATSFKRRV
jgi:hypothetical protein